MDRDPEVNMLDFYGVYHLSQAAQIVNFEVGMSLVSFRIWNNLHASTAAAVGYVIAVNVLRAYDCFATQGGSSRNSYELVHFIPLLGVEGALHSGNQCNDFLQESSGLGAWIPALLRRSDSFWGVNRFIRCTRLSGVRFDGSADHRKKPH